MKLRHTHISIPAAGAWLEGRLAYAPNARALAAVLQPSAGNVRGNYPADFIAALQAAGFATLALDLLTVQEEERDPDAGFNIPQMANRLIAVGEWISHQPTMRTMPVGLIGTGTACAAAVRAAAKSPHYFGAIVCCGGRPDLAGAAPLAALSCPIRLIVGEEDPERQILWQAYTHIRANRDWQLVDTANGIDQNGKNGRTSRFAELAGKWLKCALPPHASPQDSETPRSPGDTL